MKGRKNNAYLQRWPERLGFYKHLPALEQSIWVHTVSVGETLAAIPLIRNLIELYPENSILVTSTTPTGSERVRAAFSEEVVDCYLPYDIPSAIKRFHKYFDPQIGIVMETELWPNLLRQCCLAKINVIVANARLSQRSAKGYQRFAFLSRNMLKDIAFISCQTEDDKKRFQSLGVAAKNMEVTGNIKFDLEFPEHLVQEGIQLRERIFAHNSKIWIAASTHRGEDEKVLAIHQRVLEQCPEAKLIIVPRHPERFEEVHEICQSTGLKLWRRSAGIPEKNDCDIFIGDSMGELLLFFAMSDCAFIGGSLVPRGGHNLLEAEAFACPVVVGPYTFNFSQATQLMVDAGAAIQTDEGELHFAIIHWLKDDASRIKAGETGREIVIQNKGALQQLLATIKRHLESNNNNES